MWATVRFGMLAASAMALSGCWLIDINGRDDDAIAGQSGPGGARRYAASGFDEIVLAGSDNVTVRRGDSFSVVATGPAATLDNLVIRVDGDSLEIRRRRGSADSPAAMVTVTLPTLKELTVAGSGIADVDRIDGARADVTIAGSGSARIAAVAATRLDLTVAGSGSLTAAGRAERIDANIAGSGSIAAPTLTAARADITVAGSGAAAFAVNGPVDVTMLGAGNVTLTGGARCTTRNMGSGAVRCS
jgi:hypothetical protein